MNNQKKYLHFQLIQILKEETVLEMMSVQKGKGGITANVFGLNMDQSKVPYIAKNRIFYGHQGMSANCLCALFFTFHILCCDHFAPRGDPIRISAIQFATSTVISAVAAAVFETPTAEKIASALVPILYCGLVSGGIGYTLQIVAQKYTDPTIASLLMSMESVFAMIAGTVLLGEQMTTRELTGCLIMFVAIVLVQIPLPKRDR